MSVVDIVMSGHYSTHDLAAVSLGTSIWFPIYIFGYGIIMMLSADVAKLKARNDKQGIKESINNYLFISLLLSVPIVALLFTAVELLSFIGVDQQVVTITHGYVTAMAFGVPGVLIFNVFRSLLQGLEDTKIAMYISTLGLLINVPLNYILIFGKAGFPELGGIGAGVTTAVINTLSALFLVLYFYFKQKYRGYRFRLSFRFSPKLQHVFWVGIPSGLALFVEMVFLDIVAFGVAPLGANVIATNNIMLNIATILFTISSGIASAATVRISALANENNPKALAYFGRLTLSLVGVLSVLLGSIIWVYAGEIVALYSNDSVIIATVTGIVILLCLFQFFDSLQAALSGILRGLHETKIVFYAPIFGYWLVGIPVGFTLGLTDLITEKMGLEGFWCGLILGLAINSATLYFLYQTKLKQRHGQQHPHLAQPILEKLD